MLYFTHNTYFFYDLFHGNSSQVFRGGGSRTIFETRWYPRGVAFHVFCTVEGGCVLFEDSSAWTRVCTVDTVLKGCSEAAIRALRRRSKEIISLHY